MCYIHNIFWAIKKTTNRTPSAKINIHMISYFPVCCRIGVGIKCWTMQKKHINFQTYTRRILSSANSYMNVSISLNFFINKHWHPPMHATHTEIKIAYFYFQIYTNSMQFAVHFIPILSYPFLISFFLIYCI